MSAVPILRGNEAFEALIGKAPFIVLDNLTDAEYHALDAFSSSGAKLLLRSPAHYIASQLQRSEPTPAMVLGTAIHMAVLEPERFEQKVWVAEKAQGVREKPDAKKEREEREALMRSLGNLVLTREQYQVALNVQATVRNDPIVPGLIDGHTKEVSILWRDPRFGIPCKARLDVLRTDRVVCDLKTTTDATPDAFMRSCATYQYHLQGAVYNLAHEIAFGSSVAFIWIAVETTPPHGISCIRMGSASHLRGISLMERAMARYQHALSTNSWPNYEPQIVTMELPRWALKENEQ